MPSPQNGFNSQKDTLTSTISGVNSIDSLVSGYQWAPNAAGVTALTYSFPWATASTASWASNPNYSSDNEPSSAFALTAVQQQGVRDALATWSNVANIAFTEVNETSSNVGDLRFAWTDVIPTGIAGWAGYPSDYWAKGGDVWLSSKSTIGKTGNSWQLGGDSFFVVVHEIGHALGLKHPFEDAPRLPTATDTRQYSVMSYITHPKDIFLDTVPNGAEWFSFEYDRIEPQTPMLYDIAAIQYLYGANTSYRTGNDTYTFDPTKPFFQTLWDAGGTDTISVFNFSTDCVINLAAGSFSSIAIPSDALPAGSSGGTTPTYDGTNNLAIAFGCLIENATGGSGNDTLIGNVLSNRLLGGDGNDILKGGLGNDTIDGGSGADTAQLEGAFASYTISYNSSLAQYTVAGLASGTDTYLNVEFFQFSDAFRNANDLVAGSQNQTLTGTPGDDTLEGGPGNDSISGGAGNDHLVGGAGDDTLDGGAGVDYASYPDATGSVTVNLALGTASGAGVGFDTLISIENISGSSYADTLTGDANSNDILGRIGNDLIRGGEGSDRLYGGDGNDTLDGGVGFDTAGYFDATGPVTVNLALGIASGVGVGFDTLISIEAISGSSYADTLTGDSNSNDLFGREGNDLIRGGEGSDLLQGGGGNDTLDGGAGFDRADYFDATGSVTVDLALGIASGVGIGFDTLISIESVSGSSFADTLTGDLNSNDIYGWEGNDLIRGREGSDRLYGGDGNDTLDGGADSDTAGYFNATGAVTVDLALGIASGAGAGFDTLISIENIEGSPFSDTLTGDLNGNFIYGEGGNDLIKGGKGSDWLYGGDENDILNGDEGFDQLYGGDGNDILNGDEGSDWLYGGDGNDILNGDESSDWLYGGDGNDTLDGGAGVDTADYFDATGSVTVNLALGIASGAGAGFDTLISIENIEGSPFSDTLTGDLNSNFIYGEGGNDLIRGGEGDDWLIGGDGNDTLNGGAGVDTAFYYGGTGPVTVNLALGTASGAGLGFDTLISIENITGSSYADTLIGDSNNNRFFGSNGQDTLTGGGGADTFNLLDGDLFGGKSPYATSVDTILDFTVGNGPDADKVYLDPSHYKTNYTKGSNPFASGHLRLTQSGADTLVNLDTDGNSGPSGPINAATLKNVIKSTLTANNFGGFDPNVTSTPTLKSYTVIPSGTLVNEGASVTYTVNTTGLASGTVLGYQLTGVSTSDVVGGNLTGNITLGANGQGSVSVSLAADQQTEGNETLVLNLLNGGIAVGTAAPVTVVDTSKATSPPVLPPSGTTDDFVVLQPSTSAVAGAGVGNDVYLLSGSMIPAGKAITISDSNGANTLQLAPGLTVASSQISATALKLNLSNGASVTVLGADKFGFDVGGNLSAGLNPADLTYSQFVQNMLGTSIPASGLGNGGALVVGGGAATNLLAPTAVGDDFIVAQVASSSIIGGGAGNDTYLIAPSLLPAGTNLTISDASGANSIQLSSGLQIASAQVGATALKLNLTSGASVTVLGADRFTFEAGGNTTAGINQPDLGYSQFVQSALGVSVSTTGLVTSGAVTIGGGITTISTIELRLANNLELAVNNKGLAAFQILNFSVGTQLVVVDITPAITALTGATAYNALVTAIQVKLSELNITGVTVSALPTRTAVFTDDIGSFGQGTVAGQYTPIQVVSTGAALARGFIQVDNTTLNFNGLNTQLVSSATLVSGNKVVSATATAEVFDFNAVSALADTAGNDMQATISGFSTANDHLMIDLPSADSAITTLAQLNGQQGISVQTDPFPGSTLINFGPDARGADPVTLTLTGMTDLASVQILVV